MDLYANINRLHVQFLPGITVLTCQLRDDAAVEAFHVLMYKDRCLPAQMVLV